MKPLYCFSAIISCILLFVCCSSQGNVVSVFKPLKPIVACLKFICLFFPITALYFLFHFSLKPKLRYFAALCSPQLKFSDEKVSSQRVSLTFWAFLLTICLLRLASLALPAFLFCLFLVISAKIDSPALFHFTTSHLFFELARESNKSRLCFLNSTV